MEDLEDLMYNDYGRSGNSFGKLRHVCTLFVKIISLKKLFKNCLTLKTNHSLRFSEVRRNFCHKKFYVFLLSYSFITHAQSFGDVSDAYAILL